MTAEAGHHPNRSYVDQNGNFHLNGASFFNDGEEDISDEFEALNGAATALAALDNLSATELGYLDTVTAGTVTASKALVVDASKQLDVIMGAAQSVTPNNDSGAASTINAGVTAVDVQAVTNDANDWIVLPALADVPVGHEIRIACNAGGNFELRTPATSGEKINNVDADGTQEYLCTDTDTVRIWKLSDTDGWVAQSLTILGAVRTAVVPD